MFFNRPSVLQAPSAARESNWFSWVLVVLFILYWLFARYLERIDLEPTLNAWWQLNVAFTTAPALLVFFAELLHPRVLRHFIPVIAGWWLAYVAATSLVQALYDLPDREAARQFLRNLRSGGVAIGRRPLTVRSQTLAQERDNYVLLRVGGPGRIRVVGRDVAVTEQNSRFYRILGPGVHDLHRFEYIHKVLDLRPQERRTQDGFSVVTKDGIKITADVSIVFRLSTGGEPPTRSRPYPFDTEAVRKAAYAAKVSDDNQVSTWDDAPLGIAKGQLTRIVARYRLDEIIYPNSPANEPLLTIRNELVRNVRQKLADLGIELINVQIERLELEEDVRQQYLEYWKIYWQNQAHISLADGEAMALEEKELARAEAEVTMMQAILEGVRRVQQDGQASAMRELVALRLVEALEEIARQSQKTHPLPETLLPRLEDLRQELLPRGELPPHVEDDE